MPLSKEIKPKSVFCLLWWFNGLWELNQMLMSSPIHWICMTLRNFRRSSCGVMVKEQDCEIVECEFKLQLYYYIHFQTNAPWERCEPPYPPAIVVRQGWLWYWINHESWYSIRKKRNLEFHLSHVTILYKYKFNE